jgi:hypothetical protein
MSATNRASRLFRAKPQAILRWFEAGLTRMASGDMVMIVGCF